MEGVGGGHFRASVIARSLTHLELPGTGTVFVQISLVEVFQLPIATD